MLVYSTVVLSLRQRYGFEEEHFCDRESLEILYGQISTLFMLMTNLSYRMNKFNYQSKFVQLF